MLSAVAEYFPENSIANDLEVSGDAVTVGAQDEESTTPRGPQSYALRRVSTGITSLVGSMNGQRPGGYILVVDGLALTDVSASHFPPPIFRFLIWLTLVHAL
jgi:phospholipid-translocating ATPase